MSKEILVTGGAGYLGSVLCEQLLDAGHRVTVVDNLMYGQTPLFHLCANPAFDFVCGDARDEALMRRLVKDADVILPLAALVGAPICDRDPSLAKAVNYEAVKLTNRLRSRSQLIVYPTTNSGYGTKSGDKFCTEDTPLEPISLYGQTKVQAEAELLSSENAITLRLATVFGMSPRMRIDLLVNDFVYRAINDRAVVVFEGHAKRNYIHIRDVAGAFAHALEHFDAMKEQPYNVGLSGANLSKLELCAQIRKHVPGFVYLEAPIGEDPDKRNYIVSNQRLREAGFEARRSLDEGIQELLKGYRMLKKTAFGNG
jgi:nucleoside-diphosphate-sugar epimerase